jgi:peptidoglycan-associated lipoprotein
MVRLKASDKEILVRGAAGALAFFSTMTVTVIVGIALAGCSSRTHMNEQPIFALADGPKKVAPRDQPPETLPINDFKSSFFDFDKSTLRPGAQEALRQTAKWLKRHPDVKLQIEGFCDERGSEEYNLRLGQRRADSVLNFLLAHGIDRERMTAISYGKLPGQARDLRAQNRRVSVIAIFP